jgi:8-oxo-dGTP pyrophosphatase MutT (NUDIX family)
MIEFRGNAKTIIYKQAAALPFRYWNNRLQIMLITSRKAKRWIIPKNLMEDGLSPAELAVKEAYEEAGIAGNISERSLGLYHYEKWNGICRVEVFTLFTCTILDEWPEDTFRFRQWFDAREVPNLITNEELKALIIQFNNEHQDIII